MRFHRPCREMRYFRVANGDTPAARAHRLVTGDIVARVVTDTGAVVLLTSTGGTIAPTATTRTKRWMESVPRLNAAGCETGQTVQVERSSTEWLQPSLDAYLKQLVDDGVLVPLVDAVPRDTRRRTA